MNYKITKNELQNILQGKGEVSHGKPIQAVASYIRRSKESSNLVKEDKHLKQQKKELLICHCKQHKLLIENLDLSTYISEGAEQKIFIKDYKTVFKLNDAIYYLSWLDYFDNLLLNNYFFTDTAYNLLGFYKSESNIIFTLVEQNYIEYSHLTDLNKVRLFLDSNGFEIIKNNDYYHPQLGIILEDLHDENVLTANDILYFIDTVFYIKPEIFWHNE